MPSTAKTPVAQCAAANATWYELGADGRFGGRNISGLCSDIGAVDLSTGGDQLVLESNGAAGAFSFLVAR